MRQFLLVFSGLFFMNGLVSAADYQPNLVYNGDFTLGNIGFDSEYIYIEDGDLYDEGTYTVASDASAFHSDFVGTGIGGSNFLIVNGSTTSGKIVWQQEVPVEAGKEYMFGMMVSSLVSAAPANLEITIYINGMEMEKAVVAPGETNVWKEFKWFTDEDKTEVNVAEITIVETSGVASGNDFGIDDIQFKELVTCAYSQGYWFAKPGVEWPYDVVLGGEEYTQVEGAAFWPPASVVNRAFSQYAAIYLSGITLEKYPDLAEHMMVIDDYFADNGISEDKLQAAAGFIGEWIDYNNCLDCTPFDVEITVVPVSCFGGNDGRILVEMDGAKPFNICKYNGCIPEDMDQEMDKTQTGQYNNLSAGNYYIVVVDANGCLFTQCVTVPEPDPLAVDDDIILTEALCNGTATGTATITVTGGTKPYVVNGDVFEGPQFTFTDLAAGSHEYEVNDANLCGAVPFSFTIVEPDLLEADVDAIIPVSCFEGSDGSATILISGGTPPYYYDEVELEGAELVLEDLSAGEHEVLILDANDCEVVVAFEMTEPDPIVLDIEVTNVSCFGLEDGEISVNVSGGTPPYNFCLLTDCEDDCFSTDDAKTAADPFVNGGLQAGDYCIVVTDANGCVVKLPVTITEPDLLIATEVAINDVTCFGLGDGMAEYLIEGGTPPYTSTLGEVDGDKLLFADLGPDDYTFVVTDAMGCTFEDTFTIVEPEELKVTVTVLNHVSCFGLNDGVAEYAITGGTEDYIVHFDDDWNALVAGEYVCVVEDANGCFAEAPFEITQPDEITLDIQVTDVSCFDGDDGVITVDVTSDHEIATVCFFDGCIVPDEGCMTIPGKTLPDYEFAGMPAGWYTIVVVDEDGCIAYECVEVGQPEPIAVTLTYDDILCYDGTTDITVAGEGGTGDLTLYAVDGDDMTPVGVLPVVVPEVAAGQLDWIVMDENDCVFVIDDDIVQPAQLVIEDLSTIDVTCFGGFDGQAWITIDGGTPPYTSDMGAWDDNVLKIKDLYADDYTVEVLDANNCMIEVEFTIIDGLQIFIELVEVVDVMCYGTPTGSIEVLATGGNGGFTYSLDGVNYQDSGLFEYLLAGSYTVYVKDQEGCILTRENIVVVQPEELVVELEVEDVSCYGAADGQINGYITGGVGPYYTCLVTFCVDDYINDNPTPDKSQGFSHYDLEPGEYTVMVMDQNGCKWYQCVTIGEPEVLEASITDYVDVAVYGEATGEATVTATGGDEDYTYLWSDGQTTQTATGLVAGIYTVVVTDGNGCEVTVEVTISQPDEASSNPLSDGLVEADEDQVALRAYPNPFNSETTIEFELTESGYVTLEVYNIVGEKVAELFDGHVDAFVPHKVTLKAGSMPNGIYFYRLNNGNQTFFNKVVLSR